MGRGGRGLTGRYVLEVTRVATDGCPDACSVLYGAMARAAKALGDIRIITYILDSRDGRLVAGGWL
jgi:hypothetical protein